MLNNNCKKTNVPYSVSSFLTAEWFSLVDTDWLDFKVLESGWLYSPVIHMVHILQYANLSTVNNTLSSNENENNNGNGGPYENNTSTMQLHAVRCPTKSNSHYPKQSEQLNAAATGRPLLLTWMWYATIGFWIDICIPGFDSNAAAPCFESCE